MLPYRMVSFAVRTVGRLEGNGTGGSGFKRAGIDIELLSLRRLFSGGAGPDDSVSSRSVLLAIAARDQTVLGFCSVLSLPPKMRMVLGLTIHDGGRLERLPMFLMLPCDRAVGVPKWPRALGKVAFTTAPRTQAFCLTYFHSLVVPAHNAATAAGLRGSIRKEPLTLQTGDTLSMRLP